ncbi:hypothetical protein CTAM01_11999 [Colletotrichum tamarilloi]|uniref:Uncharacterized protein n=1 Tax=Colletotrichum tamarilloi TaxID=1209934 RepID=A0ABQ9QWE4_9PEZI|nr:uncharacterized protein CTAM01_11999 [Colletotrichum tamarilloi]KAK1487066.1 hypothetical protein CTAM01_11999 [Colletotrichum tamarilloi]
MRQQTKVIAASVREDPAHRCSKRPGHPPAPKAVDPGSDIWLSDAHLRMVHRRARHNPEVLCQSPTNQR